MTKDKFAFLPVGRETGTLSFLAVFDPLHWLCKRHENFTSCYYWYSVLEVKSDEKENARKQRKWSNETNNCNSIRLWSFGLWTPIKVYNFSPSHSNSISFCIFQEQKVFFKCKEGHSGQFVYIRDDRPDKEYFGLCEVEVFHYKGNTLVLILTENL